MVTATDISQWFVFCATAAGLCFYSAHHYPALFLKWTSAITFTTHALALSFVFGIGVVVGRYGFVEETARMTAVWMIQYMPVVLFMYFAMLQYQRLLCAIAEKRTASAAGAHAQRR